MAVPWQMIVQGIGSVATAIMGAASQAEKNKLMTRANALEGMGQHNIVNTGGGENQASVVAPPKGPSVADSLRQQAGNKSALDVVSQITGILTSGDIGNAIGAIATPKAETPAGGDTSSGFSAGDYINGMAGGAAQPADVSQNAWGGGHY